jgi:TRAP transporter TAXI family solute receptor
MRVITLLAAILLFLPGCDRTPPGDAVKKDLAARLSESFADAFEITGLSRRGSAKDISAPAGETRRIVYFDASLRTRKDIDLGSWDTPGAASLVSTLGAGPKGITGVSSGGNKAGDEIRAHGSAVYQWDGKQWQNLAAASFVSPKAPVTDNQAARPPSELLIAALQATLRSLPAGTTPSSNAVIQEELQRAVNNIRARLTHLQEGIAIAAGPEQGQYLSFVKALTTTDTVKRVRITPLITAGSVENLKLLRSGEVLFALTQGDVAALAFAGAEPFGKEGAASDLRALGSLYVEPLHVIVLNGSPVRSIADLAGRRINVGPVGSGSRVTALRVLEAHGISRGQIRELGDLTLAPALAALRAGLTDAVIEVIGLPSDEIRSAFATLSLRLVPLDSAVIDRLTRDNRAYIATLVPPGAYPKLETSISTIGVAAILTTTADLTAAEAATATRFVYTVTDLVRRGSAQGAQVSWRKARTGMSIPLHEGAERALAELQAP